MSSSQLDHVEVGVSRVATQYSAATRFLAYIRALLTASAELEAVLQLIAQQADIDIAEGVNLDVLGEIVGLSRKVSVPLDIYFAFDYGGAGFDEGFWKGPYDPTDGLVSLDDTTYRTMIRAKIEANKWDGTNDGLGGIYESILTGSGTTAFVVDNQDMSIDLYLFGKDPSKAIAALLRNGYFPIKPGGVRINKYLKPSVANQPLFGFDTQSSYVAGFDTGVFAIDIDKVVYPALDIDFILDVGFLA